MKKEFDILDFITILSFIIGFESYELATKNLQENREQTDDTQKLLNEMDSHLKQQDEILENQNKILYKLNGGDKVD